MTQQRTINCPNGCDPEELEREHWEAVGDELRERPGVGIFGDAKYGTRYICHGCGWEADWNPADGLQVNVEGD